MRDVATTLDVLGIEYDDSNQNYKALCPMHERITGEVDHNPSWYIHSETGQHICFSCGYKGNLLQLICDVKELYIPVWQGTPQYNYQAAKAWLASAIQVDIADLQKALLATPAYVGPPPKPARMSEARLAIYTAPTDEALQSRNITAEAAEHYGVLWNNNTKTWILPLRDAQRATLLGWQEKGTVERTFKNRPAGVQKSLTMFGIQVQEEDVAIVVESPLDCLRIYSAGFKGAMATYGATVSDEQAKILRASDRVIAAFDNPNLDPAGKKASEAIRALSRKYGFPLFFFNYGTSNKKDPGDMTDEEIAWGIENAQSSLLGERAYVYGDAQAVSG